MRSRWSRWISGIGAVVLIGGALLAGFGSQGAQAAGNPFNEILAKLDQILTALGGLSQGNPTLRWDQALPGAQRFAILAAFNNDAVLDKNTGLVWEKSPATTTTTWAGATGTCINKNVGGQKGWRLPAIAEQASLVDPSVAPPGPTLPPGHPFLNVQSAFYWSASTEADNPARAWLVDFFDGDVVNGNKINSLRVWCVRGPMQESVY